MYLKQVKTILVTNASAPEYEQYKKKYAVGRPLMLAGIGCVGGGVDILSITSF